MFKNVDPSGKMSAYRLGEILAIFDSARTNGITIQSQMEICTLFASILVAYTVGLELSFTATYDH